MIEKICPGFTDEVQGFADEVEPEPEKIICYALLSGCWDQQMLKDDRIASRLIGEHFHKLFQSAERRTIVPAVNLQLICPPMLDPGDDIALP
ncbi:hypothetical protein WJ0W_003600 [Paenibacillus melissococcoides]|uniref:Uncharacterized protein n=1 Tax=Paenibacillus melissococcoides TaxID=2912268 RepID=A0ABM9G3Q4_9BACL|nr:MULTISPECIES: hypothetical protein [Paenibacillus]MEB9895613.1 hypothetical protein [Bacillus cereus]CAH8246365.1 hypothetical protein WJ0W_003600 [Paenibacillus melissococcoides]CAH8714526.1 hypothetical protein HTL2_003972 [Paenibacillus melissococcoides]CAH8715482.1 hypothetical protein WDD9_004239 [Paenibacillus melissococcoides]GIO78184.1 hypothetical protein J6TS7_17940 [Paenibacillus dendritiformis]